jgi:hypothetical protein
VVQLSKVSHESQLGTAHLVLQILVDGVKPSAQIRHDEEFAQSRQDEMLQTGLQILEEFKLKPILQTEH